MCEKVVCDGICICYERLHGFDEQAQARPLLRSHAPRANTGEVRCVLLDLRAGPPPDTCKVADVGGERRLVALMMRACAGGASGLACRNGKAPLQSPLRASGLGANGSGRKLGGLGARSGLAGAVGRSAGGRALTLCVQCKTRPPERGRDRCWSCRHPARDLGACSVDGCGRPARRAGLCWGHLKRPEGRRSGELRVYRAGMFAALERAALRFADADSEDDPAFERAKWSFRRAIVRYAEKSRLRQSPHPAGG